MSTASALHEGLLEIAGNAVRQMEPWPVVAPRTTEMLQQIIEYARTNAMRVLVLGTGSSFESTFSLEREQVVAVMMYGFSTMETLSPFTARIGAGVSAEAIFPSNISVPRRTLGGLLADAVSPHSFAAREVILSRIRALEFVTSSGELLLLRGIGDGNGSQPSLAPLVLGSGGRLGVIVAAHLRLPVGSDLVDSTLPDVRSASPNRDAAMLRADLSRIFDRDGVFSW